MTSRSVDAEWSLWPFCYSCALLLVCVCLLCEQQCIKAVGMNKYTWSRFRNTFREGTSNRELQRLSHQQPLDLSHAWKMGDSIDSMASDGETSKWGWKTELFFFHITNGASWQIVRARKWEVLLINNDRHPSIFTYAKLAGLRTIYTNADDDSGSSVDVDRIPTIF